MSARVELRRGSYRDSVTLMQMSEAVAQGGGVDAAIVAMATPLNIELYERLGFDPADVADATANDLLVAIRAADDAALNVAIAHSMPCWLPERRRTQRGSARHRRPGRLHRRYAPAARSPSSRCPVSTRSSRRWTRSTPASR